MNVKLPQFVIANLFSNNLVIPNISNKEQQKKPLQITENPQINLIHPQQSIPDNLWLGQNKKNITVIINDKSHKYLNDEWLATLTKILENLQLNLSDIAIINYHQTPLSFEQLKNQMQCKYIIAFGINTQQLQLPFTIPFYQPQKYSECVIILSDAITLSANQTSDAIKTEKRKLWQAIKKIFQ